MTEVADSKHHGLEERSPRFAEEAIEFAGIPPTYDRKGKMGFWVIWHLDSIPVWIMRNCPRR